MGIYQTACDLIGADNCTTWFNNDLFFNTEYFGPVLHEYYFITLDRLMGGEHWSVRYINKTTKTIDTLKPAPLDSKEACLNAMDTDRIKRFLGN